ncbi:LysM peptidoglycan-binding domain-containing protein [Streptomyces sp. NPDC013012]|uniref:LysM peptidoglycan-binding domain-containing protein n=1 Tax=Streptomyces sp. NPDC013012 TaxID=3364860 RepID=UPI003692CDED
MSDALYPGDALGPDHALRGGAHVLTLQGDGNLVLSEPGGVVWATGTQDRGVGRAVLQHDGNFVLYAGDDAVWATGTSGRDVHRLVVQPDRNVVLYATDGSPLWASNTDTDTPIVVEEAEPARVVEEAVPRVPEPRTHTVEPGESLWAVAERFYGDGSRHHEIAAASGIEDPDRIDVGQVLTIP